MQISKESLERFGVVHDLFPLLETAGVGRNSGKTPWINPFTGKEDTEDFSNVGWHCLAVAIVADAMGRILKVSDLRHLIVMGAAHDAGKRFEVMKRKALKEAGRDAADAYTKEAYGEMDRRLTAIGVAPALLAAGQWTGHTSLVAILRGEGTLLERIIHVADDLVLTDLTGTTEVLPVRERMRGFIERYPWLLWEGVASFADGTMETVRDVRNITALQHQFPGRILTSIRPFMELQPSVTEDLSVEFCRTIEIPISTAADAARQAHTCFVGKVCEELTRHNQELLR